MEIGDIKPCVECVRGCEARRIDTALAEAATRNLLLHAGSESELATTAVAPNSSILARKALRGAELCGTNIRNGTCTDWLYNTNTQEIVKKQPEH